MDIGYLWFNLIGCILAVIIAVLAQGILPKGQTNAIESV
jgi:hypothetical protein